ncbi:hypothetical protein LDENG_00029910 [Lucifuga dentata]|nr:hypothetical protein LDENG_00029910 [Lucifuga dentata]
MKSSDAVFTRQNPFLPTSPVGKTHYHPSCTQRLSKKNKKTTLSPVRLNQRASPQLRAQSPDNQHLPVKSDHLLTSRHPNVEPRFSESWPFTDCESSSASTASSDMEALKLSAPNGESMFSSNQRDQRDSVLAKYIERFRHGQPQSREERQQMALAVGEEQLPFWWMSSSSLPTCSTPTNSTDKDVILPVKDDHSPVTFSPVGQRQHGSTSSPCRGSLSFLLETSQGELDDAEILELQERASRLLQKGEGTGSDGSIPISSEGLGCSDFSSPVTVDEPVRKPLIPSIITSSAVTEKASSGLAQAGSSQKSCMTPSMVPPRRPEEDILFQWRLRRKMEQAREWPQSHQYSSLHGSTFKYQSPTLHYSTVNEQAYKQQPPIQPADPLKRPAHPYIIAPQSETKEERGPCPPETGPSPFPAFVVSNSSPAQPQANACVPAHMHFLCDVLPCPMQSSPPSEQQRTSSLLDGSRTKVECNNTQVLGNATAGFTDKPVSKHMLCLSSASSGATQEQPCHHRRAERNKKKKAQTKKKYTVDSEHADEPSCTNSRVPKKVIPQTQSQEEESQGTSSENCTDHAPPPSPVHSAIAQVVSEVLFPPVGSSPAERTPISSVSPPRAPSAPPESPVPSCSAQNSMEVISQLLQEAEDSDGKEFENDPLLQVLRKQRKWVKEQVREVDFLLGEFQEE